MSSFTLLTSFNIVLCGFTGCTKAIPTPSASAQERNESSPVMLMSSFTLLTSFKIVLCGCTGCTKAIPTPSMSAQKRNESSPVMLMSSFTLLTFFNIVLCGFTCCPKAIPTPSVSAQERNESSHFMFMSSFTLLTSFNIVLCGFACSQHVCPGKKRVKSLHVDVVLYTPFQHPPCLPRKEMSQVHLCWCCPLHYTRFTLSICGFTCCPKAIPTPTVSAQERNKSSPFVLIFSSHV